MNLEEQVLSIEHARHLQSLGLDMSDAAMCYLLFIDDKGNQYGRPYFCKDLYDTDKFIPTYTLQEVLDKLPKNINNEYCLSSNLVNKFTYMSIYGAGEWDIIEERETLMQAAYNMLCWVLENGYLKEDKK